MILGHEVAGTVLAVGDGVDPGDGRAPVAVNPSRPCGRCRYCLEGLPNQCLDMRFYGSAMRDPHVEGASRAARLRCNPVRDGRRRACRSRRGAGRAVLGGLHGVARRAAARKRVLVSGCGPIGCLAIAAARIHGAAEIVAVDVDATEPLAVARAMGAHLTIDAAARPTGWTSATRPTRARFDVMSNARATSGRCAPGSTHAAARRRRPTRPRRRRRCRRTCRRQGTRNPRLVPLPRRVRAGGPADQRGARRHGADGDRAFPIDQAREAFELASDRTPGDEGDARLRRDGRGHA